MKKIVYLCCLLFMGFIFTPNIIYPESANPLQSQLDRILSTSGIERKTLLGELVAPKKETKEKEVKPQKTKVERDDNKIVLVQGDEEERKKRDSERKGRLLMPSVIEKIFIEKEEMLDYSARIDTLAAADKDGIRLDEATRDAEVITDFKITDFKEDQIIKQYGYDIFQQDSPLSFSVTDIPVNPDYIMGPGDKIVIYIWGKIEQASEAVLDQSGRIYLSGIGYISLLGARFGDVANIIKKELGKYYVNFDVSVTMREVKSIKVYILGDVYQPGAYEMPSLGTVFHALYAAEGPKKMGSLRKIKLIRNNKTIASLDLYKYLIKGDKSQDFSLRAGDTVFVPPIGKVAKIEGAVKRPAIYELNRRTRLGDLIDLAGGFVATSYFHRIQLERIVKGERRTVLDLEFDNESQMKKAMDYKLRDGDSIKILPILERVGNYVVIKGNVKRPGKYEYKKNMILAKLIEDADGLLEETYLKRVDIYRFVSKKHRAVVPVDISNEDNKKIKLTEWDIVKVYSKDDALGEQRVYIEGRVKSPGEYQLMKGMKVSDLVFLAQLDVFANKSTVEVFRREPGKTPSVIIVDFQKVLDNPGLKDDVLLKDQDHVIVRLESEANKKKHIKLSGEVKFPGIYIARQSEKLRSIIERAGGFTQDAFLPGVVFVRESSKFKETQGQLKVLEDEKKRFVYDQRHLSSLSQDAQTTYQVVLESRKQALLMLGEKIDQTTGRIIIDLTSLVPNKNNSFRHDGIDADKLEIEDGDELYIPAAPQAVQLIGGIQNPMSILYKKNKGLNYYVSKVGGYTDYADENKVLVFKPNGSVSKNLAMIERGDTVYVPETVRIDINWLQFLTNITQILSQTATAIATVKILQQE